MAAKAENKKVKAGAMTTAATETMTAAMDHGRTGDMADTATGEAAMGPPGTMEDAMADGALAPGDHLGTIFVQPAGPRSFCHTVS